MARPVPPKLLAMSPLPLTPSFTRAIGSTLDVVGVGDNRIGTEGTSTELLEFRQIVEPSWSLMAMRKATEEDIERIEVTVKRLEKNIETGVQTVEDDLAFHRAILETTHNPYMITIGNTILELFRSSIEKSMADIPDVAAHDHRAIFTAFKSRDTAGLISAIEASYEGWAHSLAAQAKPAN